MSLVDISDSLSTFCLEAMCTWQDEAGHPAKVDVLALDPGRGHSSEALEGDTAHLQPASQHRVVFARPQPLIDLQSGAWHWLAPTSRKQDSKMRKMRATMMRLLSTSPGAWAPEHVTCHPIQTPIDQTRAICACL